MGIKSSKHYVKHQGHVLQLQELQQRNGTAHAANGTGVSAASEQEAPGAQQLQSVGGTGPEQAAALGSEPEAKRQKVEAGAAAAMNGHSSSNGTDAAAAKLYDVQRQHRDEVRSQGPRFHAWPKECDGLYDLPAHM